MYVFWKENNNSGTTSPARKASFRFITYRGATNYK